jgi:hypothetical protein
LEKGKKNFFSAFLVLKTRKKWFSPRHRGIVIFSGCLNGVLFLDDNGEPNVRGVPAGITGMD